MKIHHIGYAVTNIEKAVKKFEYLGFKALYNEKKADLDRNVNILLIKNQEYIVELIEINDDSKESPIDYIVKNSKNKCTPYHICYCTNDLESAIEKMRKERFVIVKEKSISDVFKKEVVFLYNRDIGFVELIEE